MTILIIEDDALLWDVIRGACGDETWSLQFFATGEEAIAQFGERLESLDLAIVDLGLPGMSGLAVLEFLRSADEGLPVLIMTAETSPVTAVQCMKSGAYDYLTKPFTPEVFQLRIQHAFEKRFLYRRCAYFNSEDCLSVEMGPSQEVKSLRSLVRQVSPTNMSVLIEGESGTGKELVARRVHALSRRNLGPFVAVDCGAIPEALLEGELFGFRKGSFTGAVADRQGRFQASQNGTLFLDEIGNLPLAMQAKLLRVLQQREVTPIGSDRPVAIDSRLISATNMRLEQKVARGEFRLDLYHRIAEFPIGIPPLRNRTEDLLYLCSRILREACKEFGKEVPGIKEEAMDQVLAHPWPGNVRELQSVLRRAALTANGQIERIPLGSGSPRYCTRVTRTETDDCRILHAQAVILREGIRKGRVPFKKILKQIGREIERGIIEYVLKEVEGNHSRAARILGLDFKTVHTKARDTSIWRKQDHEEAQVDGLGGSE